MVLAITMVMVKKAHIGSDAVPGALEGPFCAVVRAEREHGKENIPGAREQNRSKPTTPRGANNGASIEAPEVLDNHPCRTPALTTRLDHTFGR
eukprot:3434999-Alexandrium_andersonii.AAC.2